MTMLSMGASSFQPRSEAMLEDLHSERRLTWQDTQTCAKDACGPAAAAINIAWRTPENFSQLEMCNLETVC